MEELRHQLAQYQKRINLQYNFWRKFRDCVAELRRHRYPPELENVILTKLLPLVDRGDYQEFLRLYKTIEQKRLEWKYLHNSFIYTFKGATDEKSP